MYINQQKLIIDSRTNLALNDFCQNKFGKEWNLFSNALVEGFQFNHTWVPRFGASNRCLVGKSLFENEFSLADNCTGISFADATDLRLYELQKKFNDRPWLVQWSGGIDSTVIIVGILKNLSKQQRQDIVVMCNPASIWESPSFFQQHIADNFTIIDSANANIVGPYCQNYYIFNGEPADCLWGSKVSAFPHAELTANWDPDILIEFYSKKLKNKQSAEWLYEFIKENILSVGLPIKNYHQWHWWINFNMNYTDTIMRRFYKHTDNFNNINSSFIDWYNSREYNLWSLDKNINHSQVDTIYKLAAKNYISEIFKDPHWYTFKTKSASAGRAITADAWTIIRDDLSYCSDPNEVIAELDQLSV